MRIGSLELPAGAALAPMAGVSDTVMRRLCHAYGAAWSVTEMVNAQGYLCAPENAAAIDRLLVRGEDEGIVGVQLFGRESIYFARAAASLEARGFAFIDINMGCPARKVTSGGSGSALLREPALCASIVAAVRAAVSCPVTVKLRAGWDAQHINAPEVARLCADAGADAIVIHGRTREQQYAGLADRGVMRAVKEAVSVPVIANGDVRSAADARAVLAETGCDAVMIGRAACGNPWIFRDILRGEDDPPAPGERVAGAVRHLRLLCDEMGESWGVIEARKHIAWYLHGIRGAAALRSRIMRLRTRAEVEDALFTFLPSDERNAP